MSGEGRFRASRKGAGPISRTPPAENLFGRGRSYSERTVRSFRFFDREPDAADVRPADCHPVRESRSETAPPQMQNRCGQFRRGQQNVRTGAPHPNGEKAFRAAQRRMGTGSVRRSVQEGNGGLRMREAGTYIVPASRVLMSFTERYLSPMKASISAVVTGGRRLPSRRLP